MALMGETYGLVGALSAFPRRLASRELERQGGLLHRRLTRRTHYAVFGRSLLGRLTAAEIEALHDRVQRDGKTALSEIAFLEDLGLASASPNDFAEKVMLDQSGLSQRNLTMLSLFDAFEGRYRFRDLVRAKTYAKLIAEGSDWRAIAVSVHSSSSLGKLAQLSVRSRDGRLYMLHEGILSELDGQTLLPLDADTIDATDKFFSEAEELERAGEFIAAADLYERCLATDPHDSVAAFNRANCLRAAGDFKPAAGAYAQAIKLDHRFSEAWFNFAGLLKEHGKVDGARHHLQQAVRLDPKYADAIYNLAALEYEAGALENARKWWISYLKLDKDSNWAKTAERGIQFVDSELRRSAQQ